MDTLEDGIEVMQKTVQVLQTLLTEEVLEYFTAPHAQSTRRAARRMLEIGALLYSSPRDALHISLWEALAAIHPKIQNDEAYARSLFRTGTWELAQTVTSDITWNDLEEAVRAEMLQREPASNGPRVVPIN